MSLFVKKHYSASRSVLFVGCINIAIGIRASFAAVGALFHKDRRKNKSHQPLANSSMIKISKEEDILLITGKLKQEPNSAIVFCENGISFTKIISTIQQIPPGPELLFHASGSNSIVGSNTSEDYTN
jgi:hypothetical protein